jgi:hypothetical protein
MFHVELRLNSNKVGHYVYKYHNLYLYLLFCPSRRTPLNSSLKIKYINNIYLRNEVNFKTHIIQTVRFPSLSAG